MPQINNNLTEFKGTTPAHQTSFVSQQLASNSRKISDLEKQVDNIISTSNLLIPPTFAAEALPDRPLPSYITDSSYYKDHIKEASMVIQSYAVNYHNQPTESEFKTAVAGLLAVKDENDINGTNNKFWGAAAFDSSLINTSKFNEVHGLLDVPD